MSEIDFRAKAERMHRRAQRAEGNLQKAQCAADYWLKAFRGAVGHQYRANRAERELERLREEIEIRHGEPLSRIVALGRRFP